MTIMLMIFIQIVSAEVRCMCFNDDNTIERANFNNLLDAELRANYPSCNPDDLRLNNVNTNTLTRVNSYIYRATNDCDFPCCASWTEWSEYTDCDPQPCHDCAEQFVSPTKTRTRSCGCPDNTDDENQRLCGSTDLTQTQESVCWYAARYLLLLIIIIIISKADVYVLPRTVLVGVGELRKLSTRNLQHRKPAVRRRPNDGGKNDEAEGRMLPSTIGHQRGNDQNKRRPMHFSRDAGGRRKSLRRFGKLLRVRRVDGLVRVRTSRWQTVCFQILYLTLI